MSTGCDHEAIYAAFRQRSASTRELAIRDAYLDAHADAVMAQMLAAPAVPDSAFEKVVIAAHLGDLKGAAGDAALRRAAGASGSGTTDLRCASVLALAKRLGPSATPDLMSALRDTNATVKDLRRSRSCRSRRRSGMGAGF